MTDSAQGRSSGFDNDEGVFERSPVPLWDQDFTRVSQWLSQLRAGGVTDLAKHFDNHPEQLDEVISLVEVTRANRAALDLIEADSPVRLFSPKVLTPDVRQAFGVTFQAIWNGTARFELEVQGRTMSGAEIDSVLHWSAPIVNGEPDYSNVLIAVFDVTHQRRLEALRAEAAELFVSVYEAAPVPACLIAEGGRLIGANESFCGVTGYRETELLDMTIGNLVHADSLQSTLDQIGQSLSGGLNNFELDIALITAGAESPTMHLAATLVRDANNEPSYLICQLTPSTG